MKDHCSDKSQRIGIAKVPEKFHEEVYITSSGAFQNITKEFRNYSSPENIEPITGYLADNTYVTSEQQGLLILKL